MKQFRWIGLLGAAAILVGPAGGSAFADETVNIGGSRAVLIKPNAPRASVILMPGGSGAINAGDHGDIHSLNFNQLVRTKNAYAARGLAVLVVDAGTPLDAAVQYMAAIKRPVTVIATSRGTIRAAEGIARGARPNALVLTSGLLSAESGSGQNVMSILGSPASLPRTLIIHHNQDSCRLTLPAGVEPFVKWSAGRAGGLGERRNKRRRSLRGRGLSRLQRHRRSHCRACRRLPLILGVISASVHLSQ
jgi:hypothetical protein